MQRAIGLVTLVVADYDEAIDYFVRLLGFRLFEDKPVPEQRKRWVVVGPGDPQGARLLLARASTSEQRGAIGQQTGGRVAYFLYTDDFWRDYETYSAAGIHFVRPPTEQPYGTVAVFADLYGNLWDLLQLAEPQCESRNNADPVWAKTKYSSASVNVKKVIGGWFGLIVIVVWLVTIWVALTMMWDRAWMSPDEEPLSQMVTGIAHLAATFLGLVCGAVLLLRKVRRALGPWQIASYGGAFVLALTTIYRLL